MVAKKFFGVILALNDHMYQRIKTHSDLTPLRVGDLLIQFPVSGTVVNELDLSVPQDFRLYQVRSIEDDNLRLLLCADIPTGKPGSTGTTKPVTPADFSTFIVKHNDNMVADESWWKRQ